MTHDQIKSKLNDYFDEALSFEVNTETQIHLSQCSECSNYLNSLQELMRRVDCLPRKIKPENDFWQSIFVSLNEIKEESQKQQEELNQIEVAQRVVEDEEEKAKRKEKEKAEKILKREQHKALLKEKLKSPRIKYTLIGLTAITFIFFIYYFLIAASQPWKIEKIGIVSSTVAQDFGELAEGEFLTSDNIAEYRLLIPGYGFVTVADHSKIHRVHSQKINLEKGSISVSKSESEETVIVAVFGVEVSSLLNNGDYKISISDEQSSVIEVNSGRIIVKKDNMESLILPGHNCRILKNLQPGLPYLNNSSGEFLNSIDEYCFGDPGNEEKLIRVLTTANQKNLVTVWNLMSRVSRKQRDMVIYTIFGLLGGPPAGVDKDALKALDQTAMQKLLEEIELKI